MMYSIYAAIAEHVVRFRTGSEEVRAYIEDKYGPVCFAASPDTACDLNIDITGGYGRPFENFDVAVSREAERIVYTRTDYRVEMDPEYRTALVFAYDEFALKHALVNIYSAFITHLEWGVLLHSCCILERGGAYLFAGHSGAGKSTVAMLSMPRMILSDEATIVKIGRSGEEICTFVSPFRSDTAMPAGEGRYPLNAVQLLIQSPENRRVPTSKMEAVLQLMNRVFYWAHDPNETRKLLRMCRELVERVPVYDLYFQKNDTFWEEIS